MLRRSIDNLELQKRNLRLFSATIISLVIFFAVSYAGRQIERAQVQTEAALWAQRIEDARVQQAELADQLAHVKSDAYVDQVAREQLGMTQPGDSVVILVPNAAPSLADENANTAPGLSNPGGSPSDVQAFAAGGELSPNSVLTSGAPDVLESSAEAPSLVQRGSPAWLQRIMQLLGISDPR